MLTCHGKEVMSCHRKRMLCFVIGKRCDVLSWEKGMMSYHWKQV